MNVAIAAPSPVPFAPGGAENLFAGLQRHLERDTPHHCELVKLPAPERSLPEVVDAYERFSRLDLSHFDVVIATKYPAWMVRHPAPTCYLQHRLRGLYDTYHLTGLPLHPPTGPRAVSRLRSLMEELRSDPSAHDRLPELFEGLRALFDRDDLRELQAFPGPFAREVVHTLDGVGLAASRIRRFAAISETVRERKGYFPEGVPVHVCPHPSNLEGFRTGDDAHLLTASRLDGPKRVSLMVEAMRHVEADIPLLVAGRGPEEERLRAAADGDPRIRFLGYVEDARLVDLYADALAVLYTPYEEDYGLVPVEAMMSGKPVVTTTDAGGPTELVRHGETGWIVPPDPEAIARAIDGLCQRRGEARAMGRAGRPIAERITWERVSRTLIPGMSQRRSRPRASDPMDVLLPHPRPSRPSDTEKLVVATTFPVHPPRGGGQVRIHHLYRELARDRRVDIVTLGAGLEPGGVLELAPNLREIRVPKSAEHEAREQTLSRELDGLPVTDSAMPLLHHLTPAYEQALARSARDARAVVASHPYAVHAIRAAAPAVELWYEAHNVESDLKRQGFGGRAAARALIHATDEAEETCWRHAATTYACTRADLDALRARFGEPPGRLMVVPNGVAIRETRFHSPEDRLRLKACLGLEGRPTALFVGSWHPPNVEAAGRIVGFAHRLPDTLFLVVGSVGRALGGGPVPENVIVTDVVEDAEKDVLLGCADLALNPMTGGSGTNLKMLDYFAAGTPVLSTEVGARGLDVEPGRHLVITNPESFPERIPELLARPSRLATMARAARARVEARYDWKAIASRLAARIAGTPPPREAVGRAG